MMMRMRDEGRRRRQCVAMEVFVKDEKVVARVRCARIEGGGRRKGRLFASSCALKVVAVVDAAALGRLFVKSSSSSWVGSRRS